MQDRCQTIFMGFVGFFVEFALTRIAARRQLTVCGTQALRLRTFSQGMRMAGVLGSLGGGGDSECVGVKFQRGRQMIGKIIHVVSARI
jgi:hypothetical protein